MTAPEASPSEDQNHAQEIQDFIAALASQPDREAVAIELGVLQSIYGEDAIRLWPDSRADDPTVRYDVLLNLPSPHDDISVQVLVSLPRTYPASSPPQLQILSKYIGHFGVDANLFGTALRIFISSNGIQWAPECVCVFDGLSFLLEKCSTWYEERLGTQKKSEGTQIMAQSVDPVEALDSLTETVHSSDENDTSTSRSVDDFRIFEAEPITDRKSVFIGRACRISHPSQVPLVLSRLMSDKRISRATHPIINAWRCEVDSVLHQDSDDNGENAAGSRLAHLLQIMDVDNVLVVVTRYYGGKQLGPDRFKHINQAARNALELGGILDAGDARAGRRKKR